MKSDDEIRFLKMNDFLQKTGFGKEAAIQWIELPKSGLRDRVDLMINQQNGKSAIGLFDNFRTGVVDLQGCPQLSPALESWFSEFRKFDLKVNRGSIRLRVSPSGLRGVWLDFANLDIKNLLNEKTALLKLMNSAIVEIGQKRKRLTIRSLGGEKQSHDSVVELKLTDPELEQWFETYVVENNTEQAIPLFSAIGGFTQPGFIANHALVREIRKRTLASGAKRVAEFGSGIGNFTLPLASICEHVDAYEVDALAVTGLKKSLSLSGIPIEKISIHTGNFQSDRPHPVNFKNHDLIFVDPPRSGLMDFLEPLKKLTLGERPKAVIYVSCFSESFSLDTEKLRQLGYIAESISLLDQFPQSRHYEIIATFQLSSLVF